MLTQSPLGKGDCHGYFTMVTNIDRCTPTPRVIKHDISLRWNSCDYLGHYVAITSCD